MRKPRTSTEKSWHAASHPEQAYQLTTLRGLSSPTAPAAFGLITTFLDVVLQAALDEEQPEQQAEDFSVQATLSPA